MALTPTQLADMQADLGIDASEAVFTDEELERLFERADESYNTAVYLAWRQLLGASSKYVDYKVAQTSVSKSQAFQQIKDMVAFWGNESRTAANQVRIVGANSVPERFKDEPLLDGVTTRRTRFYARYGWR